MERHAALAEQLADCLGGGGAEQLERLRLRGHDRQLDVAQAALRHVGRGHQREFVERQRPGGAGGHGEGHPADAAHLELAQHRPEAARVAGALDRHAAGYPGLGAGADRQQQQLVFERTPVPGDQLVVIGSNGLDPCEMHRGAVVARHAHQVVARCLAEAERLGHRQRLVGPLGCRRHQLEGNALLRHPAERDQRLERGHAAAHDRHLRLSFRHALRIGMRASSNIRGSRLSRSVISRRG